MFASGHICFSGTLAKKDKTPSPFAITYRKHFLKCCIDAFLLLSLIAVFEQQLRRKFEQVQRFLSLRDRLNLLEFPVVVHSC